MLIRSLLTFLLHIYCMFATIYVDVGNARSARGLRQGCYLILLGAPQVPEHPRRVALP